MMMMLMIGPTVRMLTTEDGEIRIAQSVCLIGFIMEAGKLLGCILVIKNIIVFLAGLVNPGLSLTEISYILSNFP